jgi:hypothetical protein
MLRSGDQNLLKKKKADEKVPGGAGFIIRLHLACL